MPINVMLIAGWVFLSVMSLAFWLSPRGCRFLSLRFFARAEQLEAGRKAYHDAITANVNGKEVV